MKNAVIYARVSTVDQKQKRNIDVQVKELQEYCHAEGLNIFHTYRDDGVSANAPDRLEKLTEYIVDHKENIDCLVFRSMTRIARKKGTQEDYETHDSRTQRDGFREEGKEVSRSMSFGICSHLFRSE